jgi:predicted XRE-type DNA-binding protein
LSAKIDEHSCEYSNHIRASVMDEFLAFIEKNAFGQARVAGQEA